VRAAAGVFELSQSSFTDGPTTFQQSMQQQLSHSGGLGLFGGSSSPEPCQIGTSAHVESGLWLESWCLCVTHFSMLAGAVSAQEVNDCCS